MGRETKDILYIGREHFERVRSLVDGLSIKNITNYEAAEALLKHYSTTYQSMLRETGTPRTQVEETILPKLVLSEANIPKTENSSQMIGIGPAIILGVKENYPTVQAYVIVPDVKYNSDETDLRKVCDENRIEVIKASELESRVKEIVAHL